MKQVIDELKGTTLTAAFAGIIIPFAIFLIDENYIGSFVHIMQIFQTSIGG